MDSAGRSSGRTFKASPENREAANRVGLPPGNALSDLLSTLRATPGIRLHITLCLFWVVIVSVLHMPARANPVMAKDARTEATASALGQANTPGQRQTDTSGPTQRDTLPPVQTDTSGSSRTDTLPPVHPDTSSVSLNPVRLALVGGTVAVGATAIHLYQKNAWWRDARTSFHFREDLEYAMYIDKLGHLYASSVMTFIFSKSLQWCNMNEPSSLVWGAVGSTLFQTYVEIEDGFSAYWGFDRVDYAANLIGAWYPVLQHHVPVFKNFQFRFSYLPKNKGSAGAIPGQTKTMIDDYEGQTFWLTVTPKGLFSEKVLGWWPDWLAIAGGVSVRDNNSPDRYLVWFLAPDLDMTRIIPQDTPFLRTLGEALNFIHFPMPAVQVSPGVVWYGLYF